jgi:hypothetical protein
MIVDTNIFIDLFQNKPEAVRLFENPTEEIVFSAITEGELISGRVCNDDRSREEILHFLSVHQKIPVDNPLIQVAGNIRRTYNLTLPDAIIAATATTLQQTLVTRNLDDFKRVKELKVKKPY